MRSVLVRLACILGILSVPAFGQQAEVGLVVISPATPTVRPGGEVTLEVYINGILDPDRLRSYQTTLAVVPLSGSTGSMGLADPVTPWPDNQSIFIDTSRTDWVFAGAGAALDAVNPTTLQIGAALIASTTGVTTAKYAGTYVFKASADALGDFRIEFVVAAPGDPVQPTMLVDANGLLLPFIVVPSNGITVSVVNVALNDGCTNALSISDGVTAFDTTNSTTDGPSHPGSACDTGGSSTVSNDIWYDYVSSCSGILSVSTCGTANFDTRVAVYDGCTCPVSDANLLACNDDTLGCTGSTSEAVVSGVIAGSCYKIRLGATGNLTGFGNLTVTCIGNDLCGNADPVSVGSTITGSTRNTAVNDALAPDCGLGPVDSPGVWYSVAGTGDRMTASLPSASYDTRLTVYRGACNTLACVGDADNIGGSQESVTWCSTPGASYLIFVHGASGASGTFTLDLPDAGCDDGNACTDDTCVNAACVHTPNYDDTAYCCDPATGALTPIDDANPCTNDVCDVNTGLVSHPPVPNGPNAGCDDDLVCTLDECAGGQCVNTDINTISCASDLDCPGETICGDGTGDTQPGLCYCNPGPLLELVADPGSLPVSGCYGVGDVLTVRVEMGPAEVPIVAAQLFLEYDPTTLRFLAMDAGRTVDPSSAFAQEFRETVDEALGTIDYVVGAAFGASTMGNVTVAVMTFDVLAECDAFVRYRASGPGGQLNMLADQNAGQVEPNLVDLAPPLIDATGPLLSGCPGDILVPPDPGLLTAVVNWVAPTATDTCDPGGVPVTCTPPSGSAFATGTTPVSCVATDSCGLSDNSCAFNVTVEPSILTVDVELSPTMAPGPFDRCITFDLWDCNGPPGADHATISQTMTFTNSLASGVTVQIPGGAWECITARDELHTLRSTAPDFTTPDGVNYTATFVGDRAQGGHWLVGANLNDDDFIDILDFAILLPRHLTLADPNTPCGTPWPDANINGDRLVDLLDLVIYVGNILMAAEPNCCGLGATAGASGPIITITRDELREMGLEHLMEADVNRDGILDMNDVTALLEGNVPPADNDGATRDRSRDKGRRRDVPRRKDAKGGR